jgi:hypothetical protein
MAGDEIRSIAVNGIPAINSVPLVDESPPDGGYAWVQVGVAFTINTFTWGQTAVCHTPYSPPRQS